MTPEAVTSLTFDYLLTGVAGFTVTNGSVSGDFAPLPPSCTEYACEVDYWNVFDNIVFDLSFGSTLKGNEFGTVHADSSGKPDFTAASFSVPDIAIGSDPAHLHFDLVGGSIDPFTDVIFRFYDASYDSFSVSSADRVDGAEVPLPASAWLLLAAVAAVFGRRNQRA